MFLLAQPKDSSFELKSPTNMVWKSERVRISNWAVNCCQSNVLVVRKVKINSQGSVFGYDIEIFIPIIFIYNKAVFYEEVNTTS